MAATARIPLQVEQTEKQAIAGKAKAVGMSVNDYVRTAIRSYNPNSVKEQEIDALLAEVNKSVTRAESALDDTLAFITASQKRIAQMERKALKERG